MKPDYSFLKAARIQPLVTNNIILTMIGCGGTGSWLAPSLARIAYVLREQGKNVRLLFVDHDTVEAKNIPRQNFCAAELGHSKAQALALRLSAAWGVEINYLIERYTVKSLTLPNIHGVDYLEVLIGCVDNAAARREINQTLAHAGRDKSQTWWLDCGNTEHAGQVVIGNAPMGWDGQPQWWLTDKICTRVPSPAVQLPDLLIARPEEKAKQNLSCAEIQIANAQSLAINQRVAAEATDMLIRFLSGTLTRCATYFDLNSGSARANYCLKPKGR